MPADLNQNGDVFGGWVMAQVDVAGAIPPCAGRAAAWRRCPSIPSCSSSRSRSAISSVLRRYRAGRHHLDHRACRSLAERNYAAPIIVKVTEAELTYVAIDAEGMKRQVPAETE